MTFQRDLVLGADVDGVTETGGHDFQGQYIFSSDILGVTAGAGTYDIDVDKTSVLDLTAAFGGACPFFFPTCDNVEVSSDDPIRQDNAYVYGNVTWPHNVTWTLGASYDRFQQGIIDEGEVNPKLGVQWDMTDWARLRLAYVETMKRALLVDQTLEPTQVAGFNQFFDDFDGTKSQRIGVGLDLKLGRDLYAGGELTFRDLDVPTTITEGLVTRLAIEDQEEEFHRAYLYWTPIDVLAVSGEVQYERIENLDVPDLTVSTNAETISVPLAVRYFNPNGLFAELGATYVHQKADVGASIDFNQDSEEFVTVDAALGFRLPNRRGLVSLEVHNLFDEEFLYQDVNIRKPEASNPRFIPERTFMLRAMLSF